MLSILALATVTAGAGCGSDSDGEESRGARPQTVEARAGEPASSLVRRLRGGGYVLAFRHAATDFSMTDKTRDLRNCSRQRNLNADGRRQARRIGKAFRRLGIPVGQVLASPFCRTRETARLAFGHARP